MDGELYRMFGHDWSSPPGKSGGKGDGVQLAVAFASVSFYYFSPGIFRWDLDLCKPAIHPDKLFFFSIVAGVDPTHHKLKVPK